MLLTHRPPEDTSDEQKAKLREQTWTYLQEMLAGGLLRIACDVGRDVGQRRRALQALGELRPGGDGSWLRALGRIKDHLGAEVRAVRSQREDEGTAPDAELAIGDALATFLGADRSSTG